MLEYIYEKENSIDKEICQQIINCFENSNLKYDGCIRSGGILKNVKDTTDLHFREEPQMFTEIDNILYNELNKNVYQYINNINNKCITLMCDQFTDSGFQIQKYIKNTGKYIYHNDTEIKYEEKRHRILTYLWYLNDVDEGGETEFFGSHRIKPKCGKFILFPACWTFPHCGKTPISTDKYIITGWIYVKD
jgi:hypothetical protein